MKFRLLAAGLALFAAGATASFAEAPADTSKPATQASPATASTPADAQTASSTSGQAAASGEQTPTAGQPDPNEKVCKKDETTGSRIGRVCKTRKEWEDEAKGSGNDF